MIAALQGTGERLVADSRKIIDIKQLRVACEECGLLRLCLPAGLEEGDIQKLDSIVQRKREFEAGDYLFRSGSPLRAIYALRSGSAKAIVGDDSGAEQVIGFYLPGELLGLEAIEQGCHRIDAVALERVSVCAIPFERLEELSGRIPGLQRQLLHIMSREIHTEQNLIRQLGTRQAAGRVACFLLDFSQRLQRRNLDGEEFLLQMSRQELASYLGLAVETVSRTLGNLQDSGLIRVIGRRVRLLDTERLCQLAGVEAAGRRNRA